MSEVFQLPATQDIVLFVLRWIHFMAGVVWIGHLYFFNFVQGNFEKTLDGETKKKVVPELRPRALWWFRWGAMFTMLSGVLIIGIKYGGTNADGTSKMAQLTHSEPGQWITYGALLGLIMWFNVWFVIWPAQKNIIGWIKKGEKPAEFDGTVARAGKFSRINTYLSVPMLFGMGAGGGHFGNFTPATGAVVLVVGAAIAWHCIWKVGPAVGKFE